MHKRRGLLVGLAMVALTGGLTACGDGPSSEELAAQIDANPSVGAADPFAVSKTKSLQEQADDDAKAAKRALERRRELAQLDAEQKAENDRILNGDGAPGGTLDESSIPIGASDPEVEKFRARLSGVCQGTQKRLQNVAKDGEKAAKSKDPNKILKAAQDYTDTLNDFGSGLAAIDAPSSMAGDYREWLGTIDTLSSTIRILLVSQGDRKKADRLQTKVNRLTTDFLEQSAGLGVTCISVLQ